MCQCKIKKFVFDRSFKGETQYDKNVMLQHNIFELGEHFEKVVQIIPNKIM